MGNTWTYSLVFEETQPFTSEFFDQVLALANDFGYQLRYPTFVVTPSPDVVEEFSDQESLSAYMCANGRIFPVWKGDRDIQVGFYPSDHIIQLGVDYNLREGRDEQMSLDLETVFLAFCQKFQVRYGYCADEWNLEVVFPYGEFIEGWQKFNNTIVKREPPLILFWVNYFSNDYFASIGEWRFGDLQPAKFVRTEQGIFIYLGLSVWNFQQAILSEDGKYRFIGSHV